MLVNTARQLDGAGVRLVLAHDIGQVRDLLQAAEAQRLVDVFYPTVQAAVDAVTSSTVTPTPGRRPMTNDFNERARRLRNAVEPVAAGIYFAPEAHAAYEALGFDGSPASADGVARPELKSYFTSRSACIGLCWPAKSSPRRSDASTRR